MNKKRIQLGLLIIALLTIAFFWGGNKEVNPLSPEEMGKDLGIAEKAASHNDEIVQYKNDAQIGDSSKEELENKQEGSEEEKIDAREKNVLKEEQENEEDKQQKPREEEKTLTPKELKDKIIAEDAKNMDKKDEYLTDPVPEGKPKPVEWQDVTVNKEKKLTATLSITCKSILNNMHLFNMDKLEVLPEDGIIYPTKTVVFYEGESVFDVLLREVKENKIHMEFVMTPVYNSNYIEGIHNLYEFDCGELSGWMYRVNGWFPNYGCSRYVLKDGDKIEWIYTCDLGRDIGGSWAVTGVEEEESGGENND